MEKIKIWDTLIDVSKEGTAYTWREIKSLLDAHKVELQDDDKVEANYESDDYMWNFAVHRERLETDEEYKKRKKRAIDKKKEKDEYDYKEYLKLKKKFEIDSI